MKILLAVAVTILILSAGCITIKQGGPSSGTGSGQEGQMPVINSFNASPGSIASGQTSTLSWQVSGASTVSISGIGNVALTGTQVVSPSTGSAYTLTATNQSGSATAITQVLVSGTPAPTSTPTVTPTPMPTTPTIPTTPALTAPPLVTFSASPTSIQPGGSATLQWNVTGAGAVLVKLNQQTVPPAGTMTVSPKSTTAYTLTATNAGGTLTKSASVTVATASSQPGTTTLSPGTTTIAPGSTGLGLTLPPLVTFSASPTSIQQGQSATLQWNVTGTTRVTLYSPVAVYSSFVDS